MKKLLAGALAIGLFFAPDARAAPPYTSDTQGTTLDGVLEALTDINSGAVTVAVSPGKAKVVCVAPTVTSATYLQNYVTGGLLSFANLFTSSGSGIIQSVSVNFSTAQTVAWKLYPFRGNPSNTTWTDHAVAAISTASSNADIFKVAPPISLASPDSGLGNGTNYSATGIGQAYAPGTTTGYFVLLPQATSASLGATTNAVSVCVTVLQDP